MFGACKDLTEGQLAASVEGTYGRLDDTLLHVARAEAGYTFRLTDEPRLLGREDPFPGVPRLAEVLDVTGARLEQVAAELPVEREVRIVNPDEDLTLPAFVVLLQAANHATEHRMHVATILSQLGFEPPELDFWAYNDAGLSRP
jgi:uncharacterized damage-inducible protein DinB